MTSLSKNSCLFSRDEKGELLPIEVELESLEDKPKIKILPLTKGALNKLFIEQAKGTDQDAELILKHCKEPSFTEDELKHMKPKIMTAIITAILAASLDVSQQSLNEKTIKSIEDNQKKTNFGK